MWSALNSVTPEMPNYKQSVSKSEKNTPNICFLDSTEIFWQQLLCHKYKPLRRKYKYSVPSTSTKSRYLSTAEVQLYQVQQISLKHSTKKPDLFNLASTDKMTCC